MFILLTNEGSDNNTLQIVFAFFLFNAFGCIKCFTIQQASSKASLTNILKRCFQQCFIILNDFLVDQLNKFPADCGLALDTRCMYLRTFFPLLLTWQLQMCFASG